MFMNPLCAVLPFSISGLANIYYLEREYAMITLTNSFHNLYPINSKCYAGAMPKGVGVFRSESSTAIFHADQSNLNLKIPWKMDSPNFVKLNPYLGKIRGTTVDASGNYVSALTDSDNLLALNKVITGGSDDTEEWVHFDFRPSGVKICSIIRPSCYYLI